MLLQRHNAAGHGGGQGSSGRPERLAGRVQQPQPVRRPVRRRGGQQEERAGGGAGAQEHRRQRRVVQQQRDRQRRRRQVVGEQQQPVLADRERRRRGGLGRGRAGRLADRRRRGTAGRLARREAERAGRGRDPLAGPQDVDPGEPVLVVAAALRQGEHEIRVAAGLRLQRGQQLDLAARLHLQADLRRLAAERLDMAGHRPGRAVQPQATRHQQRPWLRIQDVGRIDARQQVAHLGARAGRVEHMVADAAVMQQGNEDTAPGMRRRQRRLRQAGQRQMRQQPRLQGGGGAGRGHVERQAALLDQHAQDALVELAGMQHVAQQGDRRLADEALQLRLLGLAPKDEVDQRLDIRGRQLIGRGGKRIRGAGGRGGRLRPGGRRGIL